MSERMTKEEFKKWLKARTRAFAVRVFQFVNELPKTTSTQVISFQLAKSASSMGANYREATRAESRADFAHKIVFKIWLFFFSGQTDQLPATLPAQTGTGRIVKIGDGTDEFGLVP